MILVEDERVLPLSEVMMAAALKPRYASGLYGQWLLGQSRLNWLAASGGSGEFVGVPYGHASRHRR